MKIKVDNVTVTLSVHEARIIASFMQFWGDEDPYGATSQELGEDINLVVKVCDTFREGLKKRVFP